jgi:hypothetical protein
MTSLAAMLMPTGLRVRRIDHRARRRLVEHIAACTAALRDGERDWLPTVIVLATAKRSLHVCARSSLPPTRISYCVPGIRDCVHRTKAAAPRASVGGIPYAPTDEARSTLVGRTLTGVSDADYILERKEKIMIVKRH